MRWILVLVFTVFLAGDSKDVSGETFYESKGQSWDALSAAQVLRVSGICPQKRKTKSAPSRYINKKNPIPPTPGNIERGRQLFNNDAKPTACRLCHGGKGNGNGSLARRMEPPPRNFTCADVMRDLPAGQLFWIIKNGSRGTAMPPHKSTLKSEEIWQLVLYIKKFLRA